MPRWYLRLLSWRAGIEAGWPTVMTRAEKAGLVEKASVAEHFRSRVQAWERSRPEDRVWVVLRGGDGRADVYAEKWRIDLLEGEVVEDPSVATDDGRRSVVFG